MTLRTLNYGNYGNFLIMGNAGLCPSTVRHGGRVASARPLRPKRLDLALGPDGSGLRVWDLP